MFFNELDCNVNSMFGTYPLTQVTGAALNVSGTRPFDCRYESPGG